MKVVSISGSKYRSPPKKTYHKPVETVPKPSELKLPELEPAIAQTIDFKSPTLTIELPHTNREYKPAASVNERCVQFENRPKTVQALRRNTIKANEDEEEPLKRGVYYRPMSKIAQRVPTRTSPHIHKRIESIYYLRSKAQSAPFSEMPQNQNLSVSRAIPAMLQQRRKRISFY